MAEFTEEVARKITLKSSYPVMCIKCRDTCRIRPSGAMESGLNTGFYTCGKCNAMYQVTIADTGEDMDCVPWAVYRKKEGYVEKIDVC